MEVKEDSQPHIKLSVWKQSLTAVVKERPRMGFLYWEFKVYFYCEEKKNPSSI